MQPLRKQETQEDALGSLHTFGCVKEQDPRTGRYFLLRIIACNCWMCGSGKLLRQNAFVTQLD